MTIDWEKTKHDLLEHLGPDRIADYYARNGVTFSSDRINPSGWRTCFALDRAENDPSAAVCLESENGDLGRYKDSGGEQFNRSLWDFLAEKWGCKYFDTVKRVAHEVNFRLPTQSANGKKGSRPAKKSATKSADNFDQVVLCTKPILHSLAASTWSKHKAGITKPAILAADGRSGTWIGLYSVVVFSILSPSDLDGDPIGLQMYRQDGEKFPAYKDYLTERKVHLLGTATGVIIVDRERHRTAPKLLWVEGLPDALAAYAHAPDDVAIACGCGTAFPDGAEELARGKGEVWVFGDADKPGVKGRSDAAGQFARVAPTYIGTLPYEVIENHGKDTRDFFVEGGTWDAYRGCVDFTTPCVATVDERSPGDWEDGHEKTPESIDSARDGLTDTGNAERLANQHRHVLRYCHPWKKWLHYDGQRWKEDCTGEVDRCTKQAIRSIWEEAIQAADSSDRDRLISFARKSEGAERIRAMQFLARSEPGIPITPDVMDSDAWLLNCANGTLDLKSGVLRPHSPDDNLTKICPTAYNPEATSYHFDRFLEGVFETDEMISFVQRLFGYAITGDVREQILPVLWGSGSNGKSTLLSAILETLGDGYATQVAHDLLLAKSGEAHPTGLADLFGLRIAVCSETESGRRLNESLVKLITGGDRIRARRMREDYWSFLPTHQAMIVTNHRPEVRGTDHAIWRRLRLVPFVAHFWDPDKGEDGDPAMCRDSSLGSKLAAEREGVLRWLVEGCLEWQRSGLREPAEVRVATAEYRTEQDVIQQFINERCVTGQSSYRVQSSKLFEEYREWAADAAEKLLSQKKFSQQLTERGYEKIASNGVWWLQIAVRPY